MWRLLFPFRTGGYHFRKQVAIGPYTADFVCHHARVVIEVDGEQHAASTSTDARRDEYFHSRGFDVLRIPSIELGLNPDGVFRVVHTFLAGRATRAGRGSRSIVTPAGPRPAAYGRTSPTPRPSTLPLAGRAGEGVNKGSGASDG